MAKYLITVTETYRVDTEAEVEALIAEAKEDDSFELSKYTREYKEKKSKGEVVDSAFVVKLTKNYENFWECH